ncbi:MAG: hypothetical protein WC292_00125 [Clostridia bacterium]
MYVVTKKFIYRARLYEVGQELTADEFLRMSKDKVAIKRGVQEMVTFVELPLPAAEEAVELERVEEPVVEVTEKPKSEPKPKSAAKPKNEAKGKNQAKTPPKNQSKPKPKK